MKPFVKTEPTQEDLQHIEACKAACTCPKSGPSAPTVGLVWQPAIIIGHAPRCPALELIWARRNKQAAQACPFWENPPGWDAQPAPTAPFYVEDFELARRVEAFAKKQRPTEPERAARDFLARQDQRLKNALMFLAKGFRAEVIGAPADAVWLEAARRVERILGSVIAPTEPEREL